jgi:hypothetical protein
MSFGKKMCLLAGRRACPNGRQALAPLSRLLADWCVGFFGGTYLVSNHVTRIFRLQLFQTRASSFPPEKRL